MKVKIEKINSQFEQGYFTFSKKEINDLFYKYKDSENQINDIKTEIEEMISEHIESFLLSNIYFKYFTKISENNTALVLAQYCVFPDDVILDFPKVKITNDERLIQKMTDSVITMIKINTGKIKPEKVDVANETSTVYYLLRVYDGNKIIQKEKCVNSLYNLNLEFLKQFVGTKVGDKVLLGHDKYNHKMTGEVLEIVDYSNVLLTDDIVKELKLFGAKTFEDLKSKIYQIIRFTDLEEKYLRVLSAYYIHNDIIHVEDEVLNFYGSDDDSQNEEIDPFESTEIRIIRQMIATEIVKEDVESDFENDLSTEIIQNQFELEKIMGNEEELSYFRFYAERLPDLIIIDYCNRNGILNLQY